MDRSDSLWRRFRSGDLQARSELIETHIGLVHQVARKLARSLGDQVSHEDLVGSGVLGLIRALESYDPAHGSAFSTYAVPRIRGAILDDLRSNDPASRNLRQREREIAEAQARLEQELGRQPTESEIAHVLGVELPVLWRWKQALAALSHLPLDARIQLAEDDGVSVGDVIADDQAEAPDEALDRERRRERVRQALMSLRPQERLVVTLYYYEELKQAEIAQVLRVTESRVSQIRNKALRKLKEAFLAD